VASIVLSEPGAAISAFVLFCVIGVAVGVALAAGYWFWARRPDMPQGFFRHPPTRATAVVIGLASVSAFVVIGARAELQSFHRIDIDTDQVRLHFALPARTLVLARSQIGRAAVGVGSEREDTVRLVLYARDGRRYESTPTQRARCDAARLALGREDAQ
jgi:hypothetical protein